MALGDDGAAHTSATATAANTSHGPPDKTTTTKRKTETAEDKANRPIKRRASRACHSCRKRKVRCNVVESGPPCTNCRLDQVHCFLNESKRRRKNIDPLTALNTIDEASEPPQPPSLSTEAALLSAIDGRVLPADDGEAVSHVPHLIYQTQAHKLSHPDRQSSGQTSVLPTLLKTASVYGDLKSSGAVSGVAPLQVPLPIYIKPMPEKLDQKDIQYLWDKDALSIPDLTLRKELLRSFIEYVYPYMPLIDLHDFLAIIDQEDPAREKISLLLFQAVMFSGTAFIDMRHLTNAGYATRQAARKAFFQKARLLYDFDYEQDRLSLVQAILLMTFWYETPDDQKDTWHWMGVAVSLAVTIGLNRNPDNSSGMPPQRRRLWKRVWWSCFMRDRLIAMGMRRPTRIKDGDFDVPMLDLDDFEIQPLAPGITTVPGACSLIRDVGKQQALASMCIAMAQLTLCVSRILTSQYSIYVKDHGAQGLHGTMRSSVVLFPNNPDDTDEVERCDRELQDWYDSLPAACRFTTPSLSYIPDACPPLTLQRALLQLTYHTTISALHRPQVLPSTQSDLQNTPEMHDRSKRKVRKTAKEITQLVWELHELELDRYLPTTGTTVLLPSVIIHLLDIKSSHVEISEAAKVGFFRCMLVLMRLRDTYPAADFASAFLDSALRKAQVTLDQIIPSEVELSIPIQRLRLIAEEKGVSHAFSIIYAARSSRSGRITPPPDSANAASNKDTLGDLGIINQSTLDDGLASSPPDSDAVDSGFGGSDNASNNISAQLGLNSHGELTFDDMINYNAANVQGTDPWAMGDHETHGESGGLNFDDLGLPATGDGNMTWGGLSTPSDDGAMLPLPEGLDVLEV